MDQSVNFVVVSHAIDQRVSKDLFGHVEGHWVLEDGHIVLMEPERMLINGILTGWDRGDGNSLMNVVRFDFVKNKMVGTSRLDVSTDSEHLTSLVVLDVSTSSLARKVVFPCHLSF
jgi:hypothetical protein